MLVSWCFQPSQPLGMTSGLDWWCDGHLCHTGPSCSQHQRHRKPDTKWRCSRPCFHNFQTSTLNKLDPKSTCTEELQAWKLKPHPLRAQSLKVLTLKSGVGHSTAMHTMLTAKIFSLTNFYPFGPFTCIFFQNLSRVFLVFAVANTHSCVGLQKKIGHPAHHHRQLMQVPVLSACGI